MTVRCTSCAHHRDTLSGVECWHPAVLPTDEGYLSGSGFGPLASSERRYGACGMDGKMWESRRASPHIPGGTVRQGWLQRVWEAMTE